MSYFKVVNCYFLQFAQFAQIAFALMLLLFSNTAGAFFSLFVHVSAMSQQHHM